MFTVKQRTISSAISITGAGLHTGKKAHVTFRPAPAGSGIVFRRTDLAGTPAVKADCENVTDTNRGTSISENGATINTVEHMMAAITGHGIDNIIIDIDNEETPIFDGSSIRFTEALKKAGIEEQDAPKKMLVIDRVLSYKDEKNKVEFIALPSEDYRLSVMIDFETEVLSTQHASLDHLKDFHRDIAPCRTFVFLHELEYLLNHNLIKGGDLSNAIVFVNRLISQEELDRLAKLFNKPSVKVLNKGILNNLSLHFENEPARHKLLDVLGDLSLTGLNIQGHIIAKRPGHTANIEFAKILKQYSVQKEKSCFQPPFDIYKKPLYDINHIKRVLPHRPPFLLIDKILDMDKSQVTGVKNVTMNENFFVGHFPDEPVMPGVLQIEAMAQAGGLFMLGNVSNPQDYTTYFLKIENVKFRNKVVPGDTLVFSLKLISPIRRGLCHMKGVAYVADKPVMEAELLAQIIKKVKK
ncbi:MAG: bifunctional UDP-3-O-[3-hydroxymyristoyl] N-acetylglucosamine deacetylase/3-hydroxyacyl-ACP dehydratase [Bacteroidales bacterium]|nr:bifunctional UDP-3-O-[3-hydroxymyristoyl] N-acetylglucosamine deacetylase/3-hydroxyacyl-ACP dehydratase [Bacteroidales bacterium]